MSISVSEVQAELERLGIQLPESVWNEFLAEHSMILSNSSKSSMAHLGKRSILEEMDSSGGGTDDADDEEEEDIDEERVDTRPASSPPKKHLPRRLDLNVEHPLSSDKKHRPAVVSGGRSSRHAVHQEQEAKKHRVQPRREHDGEEEGYGSDDLSDDEYIRKRLSAAYAEFGMNESRRSRRSGESDDDDDDDEEEAEEQVHRQRSGYQGSGDRMPQSKTVEGFRRSGADDGDAEDTTQLSLSESSGSENDSNDNGDDEDAPRLDERFSSQQNRMRPYGASDRIQHQHQHQHEHQHEHQRGASEDDEDLERYKVYEDAGNENEHDNESSYWKRESVFDRMRRTIRGYSDEEDVAEEDKEDRARGGGGSTFQQTRSSAVHPQKKAGSQKTRPASAKTVTASTPMAKSRPLSATMRQYAEPSSTPRRTATHLGSKIPVRPASSYGNAGRLAAVSPCGSASTGLGAGAGAGAGATPLSARRPLSARSNISSVANATTTLRRKADPVSRYQRMQSIWKRDSFLANNGQKDTRWAVRVRMAQQVKDAEERKVSQQRERDRERGVIKRERVLEGYDVPTEKRRDDLRWAVRMQMR
eukprot:ANDGO_06270.mRNA.1 hypothetical protein